MKQYQTGIQETVFEIINQIKKQDINLPYITKKQIATEFKLIKPEVKDVNDKIGQALFQLQRKTKYRRPRIKKFYNTEGHYLGWTVVDDELFGKV